MTDVPQRRRHPHPAMLGRPGLLRGRKAEDRLEVRVRGAVMVAVRPVWAGAVRKLSASTRRGRRLVPGSSSLDPHRQPPRIGRSEGGRPVGQLLLRGLSA